MSWLLIPTGPIFPLFSPLSVPILLDYKMSIVTAIVTAYVFEFRIRLGMKSARMQVKINMLRVLVKTQHK